VVRRRNQRVSPPPEGRRAAPTYLPAVPLADIVPYEFNPRDNAAAIDALRASIREFGFLIPIVIDSNNVLVAGHTRVEAARAEGYTHVPGMLADHLTEDQIRAFRIIDNRVAEFSTWDVDLLSQEVAHLQSVGVSLEEYWTQEELDCLSDTVNDDCLGGSQAATNVQQDQRPASSGGRAPERTRVVIGEFVFHMPRDAYRLWSNAIKEENDFEESRIVEDLQARLGMVRYLE